MDRPRSGTGFAKWCKPSAIRATELFSVRWHNDEMSSKRYQFKLIEAADAAELETRLREAGSQQWSAVGYGVLPDGRRSVLMERKTKIHHRGHHRDHDRDHDRGRDRDRANAARDEKTDT
jgi:hypothetical protein